MHVRADYGPFSEEWGPIPGKEYENYEANAWQIRNKKTGHIVKFSKKNRIHIRKKEVSALMLILRRQFPHAAHEGLTVDHIDEDKKNNHVTNLQFLTLSQNLQKSTYLRPRKIRMFKKMVEQWSADGKQKIATYPSITEAAQVVNASVGLLSYTTKHQRWFKGYLWKLAEQSTELNPGERWITASESKQLYDFMVAHRKWKKEKNMLKVAVSSCGRIQSAMGEISRGHKFMDSKYRYFSNMPVHQFVWAAFGERPVGPNEMICHSDVAALDEDGCYVNDIKNLRLGTQSSNTKESVDKGEMRKIRKPVLRISSDYKETFYHSAADAARAMGKGCKGRIFDVLKGKAGTAYGYRWVYADIHHPRFPFGHLL